MVHKTAARNREMFASYCEGSSTIDDLAQQYGLAIVTVRQIIYTEKHLQAVSAEPMCMTARAELYLGYVSGLLINIAAAPCQYVARKCYVRFGDERLGRRSRG